MINPSADLVFDRDILVHHTMNDPALGDEILNLFLDQLRQFVKKDWANIDLMFEMHTLRGSAATVGATQLQNIATHWRDLPKPELEAAIKAAIMEFQRKALAQSNVTFDEPSNVMKSARRL